MGLCATFLGENLIKIAHIAMRNQVEAQINLLPVCPAGVLVKNVEGVSLGIVANGVDAISMARLSSFTP